MECEVCGKSPPKDNVTLIRQNEKGVKGIWRCREHNTKSIDSEEDRLLRILERRS